MADTNVNSTDNFATTTIDRLLTNQENGQVWSDLTVGSSSVPVYFVNGIPEPCNVIDGSQGFAGMAGTQGAVGAQGIQGPQGKTGTKGAQGYRGCDGAQGTTGANGVQGPQGKSGTVGAQGYRGCDGVQGPTGANGVQGPQGKSGPLGAQGPMGAQGQAGIQGIVGYKGQNGSRGAQGPAGEPGPAGVQGYKGVQGPAGPAGERGIQGNPGPQGSQGFAGRQGDAGKRGAQGETGPKGPDGYAGYKGAQGAAGDIGPAGDRGAQGETGPMGQKGYNGPKGPQGLDGEQGPKGSQGANGPAGERGDRGNRGAQGPDGIDGPQGVQGKAGVVGAQGSRGFDGTQGPQGTNGVQGPQGKGGKRGPQGAQGPKGPQGAQGPQGAKGSQGVIGYQGESGEIGAQGIVGENGSIWDDGIRLSGYNTHLFVWNDTTGKYEPNSSSDVLKIEDGAVIRIWIDNNSVKHGMAATGTIAVDHVVGGAVLTTNYPVYYAGTDPLSGHITEEDYNTVIDLTYKDGAWYYSGGLLSGSSSGGSDFEGIIRQITVSGGSVGGYDEGDIVEPGTSLQELFERLLIRDVDVKVGATPKLQISLNPNTTTLEVGSSFSGVLTPSYTDGYFESSNTDTYPVDKFNTNNVTSNGRLLANCAINGSIRYYRNNSQMQNGNVSIASVQETQYVFKAQADHKQSAAIPKTSENNDSSVKIPAGTINSNQITINGRFKFFFGIQEAVTVYTYNDPTKYKFKNMSSLSQLTSQWLNPSGGTTLTSITSTEQNPSFVIVAPVGWKITATKNSMGQDVNVDTTWYKQNTINYIVGSVSTAYQVYVSPSTEICEYKDIILTRTT